MRDYLKVYHVQLEALGPVFIGSGRKFSKKEYVLLNGNTQIGIVNQEKIYRIMKMKGLVSDYEEFMMNDPRSDLYHFLKDHRMNPRDIQGALEYVLDAGDALRQDRNKTEIYAFVKDPYGNPYVPGSSLKGMLRTILISSRILEDPAKYREIAESIEEHSMQPGAKSRRFLSRENRAVEEQALYTLYRPDTGSGNAVNDELSGLIVSDSRPLGMKDCVLCKKTDLHPGGDTRDLPIARECLKPGTKIKFDLTIDTSVCDLDKSKIMDAIAKFNSCYWKSFTGRKNAFAKNSRIRNDRVFLGGGSGYVSKTITYPLLGYEDGLPTVANILTTLFPAKKEDSSADHRRDPERRVSPHTMKCAWYNGQLLEMGLCRIVIT